MKLRYLDRILEAGLEHRPDGLAVYDASSSLTYRELDDLVSSIARQFGRHCRKKGERVAILAEKSPSVVACMLACWRVGAVYVPVSPSAPVERLEYVLTDIEPRVVCTNEHTAAIAGLCARLPDCTYMNAATLARGTADRDSPCGAASGGAVEIDPADPAYCIYTSGSTGIPNGVMISHDACQAFFEAVQAYMNVSPQSRCLSPGPLIFDVSVIDLIFPLYQGASVLLFVPPIVPTLFGRYIEKYRITHFCAPSPILILIAKSRNLIASYDFSSLQVVMTGADLLDSTAIRNLLAKVPGLQVINGYGPTEATCVCTAFVIDSSYADHERGYPIGRPLTGVSTLIVDETDRIVEDAHEGELLVAGRQLFSHYWRKPEETRRRLLDIGSLTHYRTGDIVKRNAAGELVFLGRADEEVKISGIRIHLSEIRTALMRVAGVRKVVVGTEGLAICKVIIAAVEVTGEIALDEKDILRALGRSLPGSMLPERIGLFDSFPSLPSGKIDQKAIFDQMRSKPPQATAHVP